MRIRVLGAAAGGGFPQWNCGCFNCGAVRRGDPRVRARTQDSLAISADGTSWWLVNASPDLPRQIERASALWPGSDDARGSPIQGVILTNGDLDHVLGLFSLRESWPLDLFATPAVRRGLEQNVMFRTLQRFTGQVTWHELVLGEESALGEGSLRIAAYPTTGKVPVHLAGMANPSPEDNVAVAIRQPEKAAEVLVMTATAKVASIPEQLARVQCVFFDGTFWSSDELVAQGLSRARAEDMAHWPIGGPQGSLVALSERFRGRRIYTHINNSNPILVEGSPEERTVLACGWEIAYDGMEVWL